MTDQQTYVVTLTRDPEGTPVAVDMLSVYTWADGCGDEGGSAFLMNDGALIKVSEKSNVVRAHWDAAHGFKAPVLT